MNEAEVLDQLTSEAQSGGDLSPSISDLLVSSSQLDKIKNLIEVLLALLANPACGEIEGRKAYMRHLSERNGSKCRCDTQWYAREGVENIAFGCKTCAKSSASCICVNCFEAGDHEGHDFYISKSDYGCCDCGDIFAWKSSGFCNRHPGPMAGDDPTARLEAWTLKVGLAVVRSVESHILSLIVAEDYTQVCSSHPEVIDSLLSFLIELNRLHDGLRRIIGNELLRSTSDTWNYSIADGILPVSHSLPAYTRQLWTNFVVDLMLDLDFKSRFASVFVAHYSQMVIDRTSSAPRPFGVNRTMMSDIGDFTCQVFTRPDVALALVRKNKLISVLLTTMKTIMNSALVALDLDSLDLGPAHDLSAAGSGLLTIIDHGSGVIRNQEFFQCSMDLIYILDHPEVVEYLIKSDYSPLIDEFWSHWLDIMEKLQFMNPHRRRNDTHVEFPDANWAAALTTQADLFMAFWILLDALSESSPLKVLLIEEVFKRLNKWSAKFERLDRHEGDIYSLFCPLNRILGILLFDLLDHQHNNMNNPQSFNTNKCFSLPLEALVFHSQVSLGLWRRNGESVNMESEFYKSMFFHHHMASADLTVSRLSFLLPSGGGGFDALFRFWCESFGVPFESTQLVETCTSALNGFLLFLAQMMSQQNELSLTESGLVKHRIIALLAVQERTFSQLRDPKLERWTHTMMPRNNAMLEECLDQVAITGASSLFTLSQRSWLSLDLVSPFWSWKDSQKAEERLLAHLKGHKMSLEEWFKCSKSMQPIFKPHFQDPFQNFISSEYLLGIIFAVCRYLLDVNKTDSRSLKLLIQIILRLCYPLGPFWRSNSCCCSPHHLDLLLNEETTETTVPTISHIAAAFRKHNRSWCHPWAVNLQGSSILSMLKELSLREQTLETKEWIELCISQISNQCSASSSRPKTDEIPTSISAQRKREEASSIKERLLNSIKNRQNKFLRSEGQEKDKKSTSSKIICCVICLSEEEGESIGKLGFVSESAFPCFRKSRHFVTRTCDHAVHLNCWKSHHASSPASLRGFTFCPYCNRPVNIIFTPHDVIYDETITFLTSFTNAASPETALLTLIESQMDQLALSLRKPNPESDIPSLEKAFPLLLKLLPPDLSMKVRMTGENIGERLASEWIENIAKWSKIIHSKYQQLPRQKFIEVIEMCILPWLWKTHVKLHYLISPLLYELPFEEIASIESALAVSDEVSLLLQRLYPLVTLTPVGEASRIETAEDSASLPIFCFDLSTSPGEPSLPNQMEPKYFESFLKRDKSVRFIEFEDLRFVEFFPSIIPKLPSVYQRLYTSYLQSKCLQCNSVPRRAVICLICGTLLCFNSECCQIGDLGEVSHHFSSQCARNGIGAFLQLSNSEIHLISSDQGRIMLAQWGSLYLDSHGEEDFGLSKPLQLNIPRMQKLIYEIRENSWLWRQSSKNLVWRIPIGII